MNIQWTNEAFPFNVLKERAWLLKKGKHMATRDGLSNKYVWAHYWIISIILKVQTSKKNI